TRCTDARARRAISLFLGRCLRRILRVNENGCGDARCGRAPEDRFQHEISLLRESCRNALRIEAPHGSLFNVREPHCATTRLHSPTAFANELLCDFVAPRIDASQRESGLSDPDRALAKGQRSASARHGELDCLAHLIRLWIDPLEFAFLLAKHPD